MSIGKRLAVALFLLAVMPVHLYSQEKKAVATAPSPAPGPVAAPVALPDTGYRIGPGDVLNIEVWKDPVLTRQVTVLPDGRIAYPLVGEMVAADKTVSQLKEEIEGRLARYLQDAVIVVEVRQMNSLQVYVLGRVNAPGRTILTTNVNVLQALAIAGGPNPFANRSRIKILRQEGENTVVIPFDYDDVTAGKNMESNILLRRGDVVFVP